MLLCSVQARRQAFVWGEGCVCAFQSKMDNGSIMQQNMDDGFCVSCSCFDLHAFLSSVNML